jgi:hypothetical protein
MFNIGQQHNLQTETQKKAMYVLLKICCYCISTVKVEKHKAVLILLGLR